MILKCLVKAERPEGSARRINEGAESGIAGAALFLGDHSRDPGFPPGPCHISVRDLVLRANGKSRNLWKAFGRLK
jgi:hypothetical protein